MHGDKGFSTHEPSTFTTESKTCIKRGHHIVRKRAIQFIEYLRSQGFNCIPLDKAKTVFSNVVDCWDRKTVTAYFGVMAGKSKKVFRRSARYASTGTISIKHIELEQEISRNPGYLEKLGLIHFELRGRTWFLVLDEAPLVPELALSPTSVKEVCDGSVDNLSLPLRHFSEHKPRHEHEITVNDGMIYHTAQIDGEERESVIGGERNQSSESILDDLKILKAKPRELP